MASSAEYHHSPAQGRPTASAWTDTATATPNEEEQGCSYSEGDSGKSTNVSGTDFRSGQPLPPPPTQLLQKLTAQHTKPKGEGESLDHPSYQQLRSSDMSIDSVTPEDHPIGTGGMAPVVTTTDAWGDGNNNMSFSGSGGAAIVSPMARNSSFGTNPGYSPGPRKSLAQRTCPVCGFAEQNSNIEAMHTHLEGCIAGDLATPQQVEEAKAFRDELAYDIRLGMRRGVNNVVVASNKASIKKTACPIPGSMWTNVEVCPSCNLDFIVLEPFEVTAHLSLCAKGEAPTSPKGKNRNAEHEQRCAALSRILAYEEKLKQKRREQAEKAARVLNMMRPKGAKYKLPPSVLVSPKKDSSGQKGKVQYTVRQRTAAAFWALVREAVLVERRYSASPAASPRPIAKPKSAW